MKNRLERQKKRVVRLRYIIIAAILLLAGGGWAIFQAVHQNDEKKAQAAADKFIKILEHKSYEKLGTVLDKKSYQALDYTLQNVKDRYDHIFNGINMQHIRASNVQLEKSAHNEQKLAFQLSFTTPLGKMKNITYHTKMVKNHDRYQVKWYPSLIFPGMAGKDQVAFNQFQAERGEIIDRNENKLAANENFKRAGVVINDLSKGDEKKKRLQAISDELHISAKEIKQKLQQSWVKDDLFVPLKIIPTEKTKSIAGISYQDTVVRYYPLKEAAANIIGYTGKVTKEDIEKHPELAAGDTIGKAGLEKAFDKQLRGTNGGEIVILDENEGKKKVIQSVDQSDGKDVHLTIDAHIQQKAYEQLDEKAGSTVVMDPKKGGLFALVSSPSYDPNKMVQGISQKEYDSYAKDKNQPFISRYASRYAPGSTFKTITASIGMDAGVTYPSKQRTIHGRSWQKDKSWGGYSVTRVSDVTDVDMRKALIYSDNIYFAQEALQIGEKRFRAGLKKFIFGDDLDLPIAMHAAQISNDKKFGSEILLADTGYGQGQLLISPIQQAMMYSVFENDGKMVYPQLLTGERDVKTKQAISKKTANEMKKRLQEVVTDPNGTAHSLYDPNRKLAAKTGTAELKMEQGKKGDENSFLLAFDTENDRFLTVSLVENYTSGASATQLNKPLIQDLYNYLQEP